MWIMGMGWYHFFLRADTSSICVLETGAAVSILFVFINIIFHLCLSVFCLSSHSALPDVAMGIGVDSFKAVFFSLFRLKC